MMRCGTAYAPATASQSGKPFALRLRGKRLALGVQAIEEERRQRHVRSKAIDIEPASESAHRLLKRQRRSVALKRQHLAVEDDLACRQRHDRLDDLRHGGCHIPERAREHAHFVTGLVHLDARAIELQLEGGLPNASSASATLSAGDASIGSTGRNSWIAYLDNADDAFDKGRAGHLAKIPAHHRRLTNGRRRCACGFGHRFGEYAFLRALAQLARQQAREKILLGLGRAAEQIDEMLRSSARRTRAADTRNPLECS